jgi:hypothetical protein
MYKCCVDVLPGNRGGGGGGGRPPPPPPPPRARPAPPPPPHPPQHPRPELRWPPPLLPLLAAAAAAPPACPLVFPLPFLHPRDPRSRSTCFGVPLVEVDDGRRSPDSRHLWSDLHSPPSDLLTGCSSAPWSPRRVDLGRKGAAPSVSRLACVRSLRPRPPTSLLWSLACCWRALVGRGRGVSHVGDARGRR